MSDLQAIIAAVEQLRLAYPAAESFLEVRDNEREVVVGGNESGLLDLALHALRLAAAKAPGAHVHIDEHSGAAAADKPLVLRRSVANWV